MILFWLKTSIAASSMRVQCKSPNTLLGVIPLGSSTQTIPLRNIASVDTNIFLIAGLACMKDSALVGILFLVLAAANLANTMSAQLDFVNQAGGRNTVKVSILEKAKLMQLAQAIQQLVFADVEGQRHQESMDMDQKQYAAQTNSVLIQQQMLDQQRKANAGDNPPDDLPDWIKAEASAKRRAAAVREAAVLLEAEGVAVDYTYLPEETD